MADNKNSNETKTVREIKMGDIDLDFKREITSLPGMEKLRLCFQCGSCTADCPIARFSDVYNPRRLLRMTQLGMKDRVLNSDAIWLCAACFTCVDHCPQGVDMSAVLRALRNLAVKEGVLPNVFKELTDNIAKTGYAYKIPELRIKRRAERGLPDLPKSDVTAVSKLFDVLGIQKQKENK